MQNLYANCESLFKEKIEMKQLEFKKLLVMTLCLIAEYKLLYDEGVKEKEGALLTIKSDFEMVMQLS